MSDQLEDRKTALLETLAELRHEENVRRQRLARIQAATRRALSRQTVAIAQTRKVYPAITFTDPPGTGALRMHLIHREIDEYQAGKRSTP